MGSQQEDDESGEGDEDGGCKPLEYVRTADDYGDTPWYAGGASGSHPQVGKLSSSDSGPKPRMDPVDFRPAAGSYEPSGAQFFGGGAAEQQFQVGAHSHRPAAQLHSPQGYPAGGGVGQNIEMMMAFHSQAYNFLSLMHAAGPGFPGASGMTPEQAAQFGFDPNGRSSATVQRRNRRRRAAGTGPGAGAGAGAGCLGTEGTLGDECGGQAGEEETPEETLRLKKLSKDADAGDIEAYEQCKREAFAKAYTMSLGKGGCYCVQTVLEKSTTSEQAELSQHLHGRVRQLSQHMHGNYVIQKILECCGTTPRFISQELKPFALQTARHRCGCRILIKIIRNAVTDGEDASKVDADAREMLLQLLNSCADLCKHSFGHHVISSMIEHDKFCREIAQVLAAETLAFAENRNASYVLEAALKYLIGPDFDSIANNLNCEEVVKLAGHQFGSFVVKALMKNRAFKGRLQVAERLDTNQAALMQSKFGISLVKELRADGLIKAMLDVPGMDVPPTASYASTAAPPSEADNSLELVGRPS
mmetsp:Transcript_37755/g.120366  ORF Transcript_37755/g.120366 Transcript_37755/m.120366 type:complete len:531 (-) Transcript_37755:428-2020(-)